MGEKLKALDFTSRTFCNLKIGSMPDPNLFRYVAEYTAKIEKKKDSTSISFIINALKLKFTLYHRNFYFIIQKGQLSYYIVIANTPAAFRETQIMSKSQWVQEDLHFLNPDKDDVLGLLFPLTLVFRIEFTEYFDAFDNYIDCVKCDITSREVSDIHFSEYPLPDYSLILNTIEQWDLKYMILVLLTNHQMTLADITAENLQVLNSNERSLDILEQIWYNYEEFSLTKYVIYNDEPRIDNINEPVNENKISVRKLRVTPSTIIFEPPEPDVSNRVTRKFTDISPDFYVRISFEDENGEKRIWTNCTSILEKFKSMLMNLEILGRHYEFLGFSNSQMKNHSCWMIARESGYTADDIRSQLGNFSKCKNNSKLASRLGLCFSGTYRTLKVERKKIPDIEYNGYCFTDGVGKISVECMEKAKSKLNIPYDELVCALQVRIGGCKGVLALNQECENVEVRPSMDKFDSNDTDLEVCSMSAFRFGYLNRQIILLLNGRGVREEVFMRIQANALAELEGSLIQEDKADEALTKHEKDPFIKEARLMLNSGVKIVDEPFLQRLLTAVYRRRVSEIKNKARILAPDSLILLGIVDEYAILNYGEVFIYPSKTSDGPITGKVVIAKNPCLHPGDIRVLIARDIPQLYYLKDVLVFPQLGKRPHPNECSGSDLDGDMYFVSWNTQLIPTIEEEEPMDYKSPPEKIETANIEGVINFFTKYMESENLGNIANTHLALADMYGIYDRRVLTLAELHSKAVDYPKTGVPAIIPADCRVKDWPDYMEKPNDKSYRSEHVIGKMYRMINDKNIEKFKPLADGRYLLPGYKNWVHIARGIYAKYSKEIKKLMRKFCCTEEFSLITLQPGDKVGKRSRQDDKIKMQDFVKDLIKSTSDEFEENTITFEEKSLLASACYWLVYSRDNNRRNKNAKFLSFPWIFADYLINHS